MNTEILKESLPLVSVIIPCYNHAHYLPKAVESVVQQRYPKKEIIVVDDGSSDDTASVCQQLPVTYVYQANAGLSAARNKGIQFSKGELLLFLDADDWLYPEALAINSRILLDNPTLAFVSGGHRKVLSNGEVVSEDNFTVEKDHYLQCLRMNYIGMHATVMYRRWVFNNELFNEKLPACEDYDLYLRISRKFPVSHHTHIIAAYRQHQHNMSGNIPKMLKYVLTVLHKQRKFLTTKTEWEAYRQGIKIWTDYYTDVLLDKSKHSQLTIAERMILWKQKIRHYRRKIKAKLFNRKTGVS